MRAPVRTGRGSASRGALLLIALVLGSGVVLGLFWWGTTFRVRLDDAALSERLAPGASPREAMHAIEELSRRFDENRPGMERWVAPFLASSRRPEEGVRVAAAWCMQYDAHRPEVVARLRQMVVDDPSELVRRNAATSLAVARDPAALPALRAILEPFPVVAPWAGRVATVAAPDDVVRAGDLVARIETAAGELEDVRAAVPGWITDVGAAEGATVAVGAPLVRIRPSPEHVANAVAGLALVGTAEDAARLRALADARSRLPDELRSQARAAAATIEARGAE